MRQMFVIVFTLITNLFIRNAGIKPNSPEPDLIVQKMSQMSLEEKVRQTLICSFEGDKIASAIKVLESCGNLIYSKGNLEKLSEFEINQNNRQIHDQDSLAWIMIDQEGGTVSRIKDGSPSPRSMTKDNTAGYWGKQHGRTLKDLNFDIDLAPVADITTNNPVINNRSFSDDPTINGQQATEYLKGLQSQGVLGVIKHLPGHGRADKDTHKSAGSLDYSWNEIQNFDLVPFIDTINNSGTKLVMVGHISIPELDSKPASISPIIIEKLRLALPQGKELIFMTDSLSMKGVGLQQETAALEALLAGEDMILVQGIPEGPLFSKIISAYKDGTLSEEKLNQSVTRILQVKLKSK